MFPNVGEWGRRGAPGTFGDFALGFLKANAANPFLPVTIQLPIFDKELLGAAVYDVASVIGPPAAAARGALTKSTRATNVPRGVRVGGGASLDNLSPGEIARIQEVANRRGLEITVVGGRARGTADAASDWDYIIMGGNSRTRAHALRELPRNPNATRAGEHRPGSEILRGVELRTDEAHIIFTPQ